MQPVLRGRPQGRNLRRGSLLHSGNAKTTHGRSAPLTAGSFAFQSCQIAAPNALPLRIRSGLRL
jgi:hypothetical protein